MTSIAGSRKFRFQIVLNFLLQPTFVKSILKEFNIGVVTLSEGKLFQLLVILLEKIFSNIIMCSTEFDRPTIGILEIPWHNIFLIVFYVFLKTESGSKSKLIITLLLHNNAALCADNSLLVRSSVRLLHVTHQPHGTGHYCMQSCHATRYKSWNGYLNLIIKYCFTDTDSVQYLTECDDFQK